MSYPLVKVLLGFAISLAVLWVGLVIALVLARPRGLLLREALRILPDTLRLVAALAGDRSLPAGVRRRLWFLMIYLAMPIDLIPDFIPVLGQADDAILIVLILRSVVRLAGLDVVRAHWRGSDDGFTALSRLTGIASRTK